MTTIAMMAMIWYIPGWMRTETPQAGCLESLTNTYETAEVAFKGWNGNVAVWPKAVENADATAERIAAEVIALPEAVRTNLTIVGHSLGGRITARVLARLAERDLKVRQAVLMAAAIPFVDPDVANMGKGSALPVIAICNPDDVTLRYVYTLAGGEEKAGYLTGAYGANGTVTNVPNVVEYVTPTNITQSVKIDHLWGRSEHLKEIANHHVHFYLQYLRRIVNGEEPCGRVMVPQHLPTVEGRVMDAGVWWKVLDECAGWKLERNVITGHCRILDAGKVRRAWGGEPEMRLAFAKTKDQLCPPVEAERLYGFGSMPRGVSVALKPDGSVRFYLAENATTGYTWEASGSVPGVDVRLEHTGAPAPKDGEPALCGAPGKVAVVIVAKDGVAGEGTVTLNYRRPWEKDQPPAESVVVRIRPE